jgi:small subunit ribosomal protein S5
MNKHRHNNDAPKEFGEAVIQIDRVTRVVKGGRRLRFRATVCVGNQKGKVGIGIGKSNEVTGAIQKATHKAKKNMFLVPLDGTTLPHDAKVKFKSSQVLLMPASEGTGIIAGGTVRKVLELAGVKNILSKAYGSNNRVNIAKATLEALKVMRTTPVMERKAANPTVENATIKTDAPKTAPKAAAKVEAPKKAEAAAPAKKVVAEKKPAPKKKD